LLAGARLGWVLMLRTAAAVIVPPLALCGCSMFDNTTSWFPKSFNFVAPTSGYSYSQLDEARMNRPIAANDLVEPNGTCPRYVAQAPAQPPSADANAGAAAAADTAALIGSGIAIGMSECDVVARLGPPTAVNLGRNPDGDRSAVLTFNAGPRPGVYRFAAGRLTEMDRVEAPPPPPASAPPEKKKVVKKKPEKPKAPANAGDKS